jgi:DNA modification methylase
VPHEKDNGRLEQHLKPATRMGRGAGWRKAAQHSGDYIQDGPRPKNNANFDLHLGSADLVMMRNKRTVWSIATKPFKEAHFATFPPALIEPCILAGCPKGGIVLDPFGGAGTTALVAEENGRNSILIEINPKYSAMAEARVARQRMGPEEKKRANIKSSGKLKPPKGLPLFTSRVTKSKSVPAPGIAAA